MTLEAEKHWQVAAALSRLDAEDPPLDDYVGAGRRSAWEHARQALAAQEAASFIQAARAAENFSGLAEIHPSWLLEILKQESPRVIGVVLRHLPSRHVRYLLEHFPKRVTMELPKLVEAFYVPAELLDVIRRSIERHFIPMRISRVAGPFPFSHLTYLKTEELATLAYELGLSELALALAGASKAIAKIVLNRFPLHAAKAILHRMKMAMGEPAWFLKEARYSVLELSASTPGPVPFLNELGRMALAKAVGRDQTIWVQGLCQKMDLAEAHLFKRCWEEVRGRATPAQLERRQAWVLDQVRRLSEAAKIDAFWAECFQQAAAA